MRRYLMASLLVVAAAATFAPSSRAHTASASAPGCGTTDTKFEIKTVSSSHPYVKPEPGKAMVYFLQDDTAFASHPRPSTRFGLDGEWIGGTQSNSYFYVAIDPGEHHMCGEWQNFVGLTNGHKSGAASFNAEDGGTYFFIVRDVYIRENTPATMYLDALDPDEAQLLMSKFAFATSHPKK